MEKRELEERLINFAVLIVEIVESLPETRPYKHLGGQLLRSGTSPALNYGEAQGGESRRDFIHKIKIVLEELRETNICLKIIIRIGSSESNIKIANALKESNELISIFVKTVNTAQNNLNKQLTQS